jgi:hypothetical protein
MPRDVVLTDELRRLLKKKPKLAIALRVKLPKEQHVTEAAWRQDSNRESTSFGSGFGFGSVLGNHAFGSASSETEEHVKGNRSSVSKLEMSKDGKKKLEFIEAMEKEFIREGFTVRDRALLENLLAGKDFADYAQISKRLQTDIFVEITDLDFGLPFYKNTYKDEKNVVTELRRQYVFEILFNRFKGKIIIVENGALGGMLEFNHCIGSGEIEIYFDKESVRHKNFENWVQSLSWNPPAPTESAVYTTKEIAKVLRPNGN